MSDLSIKQFEEVLALIPQEKRAAYVTARERCHPRIFEEEAPPRYFLARDGGDPWKAAQRMIDYWKGRVELFGERAYYPLLTSNEVFDSALDDDDLQVLRCGQGMLMPPNRNGSTVVLMDSSRLTSRATESRLRCFFYLFHKALIENESDTAYNVEVLGVMVKQPDRGYDFEFPARFLKMPDYMPICITAIHLLVIKPSISGRGRLLEFGMKCALKMAGSSYAAVCKVHSGGASNEAVDDADFMANPLLLELKACGFLYSGLPELAGGGFTDDRFKQWLKRQGRRERQVYFTDDDLRERQRQVNKRHSRNKRLRRNQEIEDLKAECDKLVQANQAARVEQEQLERLVGDACETVEAHGLAYAALAIPEPIMPDPIPAVRLSPLLASMDVLAPKETSLSELPDATDYGALLASAAAASVEGHTAPSPNDKHSVTPPDHNVGDELFQLLSVVAGDVPESVDLEPRPLAEIDFA